MRTILSCILSIALVLCSTPIAYASESVSSYSSSEGTSTHDGCVLTNRAGSTTDAQDRAAGTALETTSQLSASCPVCDFISTVNPDGLFYSPGFSIHLSLSSLAASSSGAASVITTVSDSVADSLADFPIVSLFIPALAWADDGVGEEENEEGNEEVLDDALSDVVFGYSADSSTSSDSSSSDLQEEVESYDTTEYGLSTLSGIEPLTSSSTSISIEYIVGYLLFSFINTFLDLGYATFEDWLYDVLGIEIVDYSEEIYNFLFTYTYSQLGNIVYYTGYLATYLPSIEEWTYQTQRNLFYGLFDTTYTSSGYRPYLYLIYNLLSEYFDIIHLNVLGIYELLYQINERDATQSRFFTAGFADILEAIETVSSLLIHDNGSNYLFLIWNAIYDVDVTLGIIYDEIYEIKLSLSDVKENQTILYAAVSSISNNLGSYWSTTNSYLADLYSLNSTISGNLLTISLLLQSDDFLSGISGSSWTDDEIVSVINHLYEIDFYSSLNNTRLLNIMNYLLDIQDLQEQTIDAIEDISVDVTVNVVDEDSFSIWDLLIGAIAVATITSALSDLATSAEDTFPIGALVMVAQFLVLLSADPVAPVYSGEIYGVTVEIDLSPYDNMALICRYMLFALYVIGLYKSTKDWAFPTGGD